MIDGWKIIKTLDNHKQIFRTIYNLKGCGIMENEINNLEVQNTISTEEIKKLIYTIRGKQVMLDSDVDIVQKYTDMSRLFNAVVAPTRLDAYKHIKYKAYITFK